MHYNCLIIDDEIDLAKMTCEYFQMFDTSCAYVEDSQSCLSFLEENTVDLLLLDINLSQESGFQLCKSIRMKSDIPILFISARQSDDDVLIALNIGGDDYIKKPYSLSVLLAKVKVVLKRLSANTNVNDNFSEPFDTITQKSIEDFLLQPKGVNRETSGYPKSESVLRLDETTFSVYIRGEKVSLKAKEFRLLQCLFENRNTIVTKEILFNTVWKDTFYSDGTLNVHIRRLREKIEENPNAPTLIKTIWGTGYMLEMK